MRYELNGLSYAILFAAALCLSAAPAQAACFLRGDVDDDGDRGIDDAIVILNFLFRDGAEISCRDAADVDDDGRLTISDGVYLLLNLFGGRDFRRIFPPFSTTGPDPTEDALTCDAHSSGQRPYGLDLPNGALVFVVDRSSSMRTSDALDIAKTVVGCSIDALVPEDEFGVVFYDTDVLTFPASGEVAEATDDTKKAWIAWVARVQGGSGYCIEDGLIAAIQMANGADAETRTIVYLGRGGGSCRGSAQQLYLDRTLDAVDAENTEGVVIHAVEVLELQPVNSAFLEELAARNGGEFVRR